MSGKKARDLTSGTIYHATHENSGDLCRMTDKTEQVGSVTYRKAVQLSTNKEFRIHPAAIIWPVEDKT